MSRAVHVGIPAHDEGDWLPQTLDALAAQDFAHFHVWVCVNQPQEYADSPDHRALDQRNRDTVAWLRQADYPFPLHVLSALDPGVAPPRDRAGAGWARRFLWDRALQDLPNDTLCISMDADTHIGPGYLTAVHNAFTRYPNAVALAAPYYHPLPDDPEAALMILRYEIYMRHYQLSLWRIGSPYAYLPIGSGMAFTAQAWRAIGGMAPRKAGEDFYFMQQMRKLGPIIRWIPERIEPSPRVSVRNPFGTGPAMSRPDLLAQRYPFYAQEAFDHIAESYARFPLLHTQDIDLPIDSFLAERLGGKEPFRRMRRNHKQQHRFVRACHERFDALRILQFLRYDHAMRPPIDEAASLAELMARLKQPALDYRPKDVRCMEQVRAQLFEAESQQQRAFMAAWHVKQPW